MCSPVAKNIAKNTPAQTIVGNKHHRIHFLIMFKGGGAQAAVICLSVPLSWPTLQIRWPRLLKPAWALTISSQRHKMQLLCGAAGRCATATSGHSSKAATTNQSKENETHRCTARPTS